VTLRTVPVDLGPGIRAWFTGADGDPDQTPRVGVAGNLSHRRPHEPGRLAEERTAGFGWDGVDPDAVHLMKQVHGATVATVDQAMPEGAELPDTDAMITRLHGRPLAVLTADCVPVLVAGREHVGVVHAGRVGLGEGVVQAVLGALEDAGEDLHDLRAAIGPAIGPCCYEVEDDLAAGFDQQYPGAAAQTTWSTPSIDLPGTVAQILRGAGARVESLDACTHCHAGWFSHRQDPATGRQAGVVVRVSAA
jgi:polyphenol oxidase